MGIQHSSRILLAAASLALASTTMDCGRGSADDSCPAVADGSQLLTQSFLTSNVITVQVYGGNSSALLWENALISSPFNVTSSTVELPNNGDPSKIKNPVVLTLYLPQQSTTSDFSGQFTFEAVVMTPNGSPCTIQRVFQFIIMSGQLTLV